MGMALEQLKDSSQMSVASWKKTIKLQLVNKSAFKNQLEILQRTCIELVYLLCKLSMKKKNNILPYNWLILQV